MRNYDGRIVSEKDIKALTEWIPNSKDIKEIPYIPSRVLMQDFTGVPAIVDFDALR